jgi:hypothetical protein
MARQMGTRQVPAIAADTAARGMIVVLVGTVFVSLAVVRPWEAASGTTSLRDAPATAITAPAAAPVVGAPVVRDGMILIGRGRALALEAGHKRAGLAATVARPVPTDGRSRRIAGGKRAATHQAP